MAAFSVSALSLASSAMAAYDPLSGKISLGGNHACAVTTSSGVKCWGDNAYGQLGDGTTAGRATPADVSGLTTGGASVTAGLRHSCALTASGGAKCWGWNVAGQLGDGTTTDRLVPTDVSGLTGGVASVVAGGVFTCALTTVGGLKCWGIGGNGQLGNGTTATRLVPTDVTGLTSGVSAVIAGAGHTCALTTAGGVKCWGLNSQGELGDGTGANQTVPVDVSGLASGIKGIGTSEQSNTTCAVTVAGGVKCWGDNRFSKLGDGTTNDSTVPLDVPGLPSVAAIAVGTLHVCALTTAGGVKCWGYNANGELGDGTVTTRSSPTDVIGLTGTVAAIYAGNSTSCALMTSGDVYCWGFNDRGQLGDGTTANRTTPVLVSGVTITNVGQSITFGPQGGQTFMPGGTFAINPVATASSGLAVSYTSTTPSVCTVSGTAVAMVSGGICTIAANQAGGGNFAAAVQVTQSVAIATASQTITFGAQAGQTFAAGGTFAISPAATASSGLAVTYSATTTAVCAVAGTTAAGTTVIMFSAGTCTLVASQAGNVSYNAALPVMQSVTIGPGTQVIAFASLSTRPLGSAAFSVSATGGASGNAVTFVSLTTAVCTTGGIDGSIVTLVAAGTCTIRASQAGDANYTAAAPVSQSFAVGGNPSGVALSSSANPGAFGATVTFTAAVTGTAPGGTVDFRDGIELLCAYVPVTNGTAVCTTSALAEGAHRIVAVYSGDTNNTPSSSQPIVQVVPKIGRYQGAWWGGASENGWGLSLIEHGNTLVAGWYFYDASGSPTWLIIPGCAWTDAAMTTCTGPIQRSTASWFGNYNVAAFAPVSAGTATLRFSDANTATFDYVVNGVFGRKSISRMAFGANPFAPFDFTDVWWGGADQNGWGVALYQAGGQLVGSWYTYDAQGAPTWLLFNGGTWLNDTRFKAQLIRATGSPFGGAYDAAMFRPNPVGELYFEFLDNNHAEMTYVVDGITQFKSIGKLRF